MEIINARTTTAKKHDTKMLDTRQLLSNVKGDMVGDKGYIDDKTKQKLALKDINLITSYRIDMKKINTLYERQCLKKRKRVETVFSVLKDHYCLIYRFARSIHSFYAWSKAAILAYQFTYFFRNLQKLEIVKSALSA